MSSLRIAIGSDHRGYTYKEEIKKIATTKDGASISWLDVGTDSTVRTDYPIYTNYVVEKIKNRQAELGILVCGSGAGVVIAANRTPGIYAGVAWNPEVSRIIREHDNVNLLSIPADFVDLAMAQKTIHAWLTASFLGGRYQLRIDMIDGKK